MSGNAKLSVAAAKRLAGMTAAGVVADYLSEQSKMFLGISDKEEEALKTISDVEASKKWPDKIVTKVSHAEEFWEAEDYHQDYLVKNPNGYTCHFPRKDWVI